MEDIKEFLRIESGSGSGSGDGYGDGDGSGYGYGSGSGYGDGYGSGSGYGDGDGSGSGDGDGSGSGYGSGYGLKQLNQHEVYKIDSIQTIISTLKNNIAKGYIINDDLTLTKCFVVRNNKFFAHGKTLKEAFADLTKKTMDNTDVEEKINMFKKEFNNDKKYKASKFFDWHGYLTGSCQFGRESFIKNRSISMDDEFTVAEFVDICKNSYGYDIIERLLDYYRKDENK